MENKNGSFGITNSEYKGKHIEEGFSEDINTLERIFEIFNEKFFNNELEQSTININSKLKKEYEVTGFDHYKKHSLKSDDKEHCIGIHFSDKVLNKKMEDVALTVLLAMIFQKDMEKNRICKLNNIRYHRAITNNGNYYSKAYKSMCNACGLDAEEIMKTVKENDKSINRFSGKYIVKPNEKFMEVFNERIKNYRLVIHPNEEENSSKKSNNYLKTYTCLMCGLNVMVKRKEPVKIGCFNKDTCNGNIMVVKEEF